MNVNVNVNGRLLSLSSLSFAQSLLKFNLDAFPTIHIHGERRTRSPWLFNLLIRVLSSSDTDTGASLALRYFLLLLRYSHPDSYTFPFVFRALSSNSTSSSSFSSSSAASQAGHSLAFKLGFLPRHQHTAHSLITMYSTFNLPAAARKVFDQIPLKERDLVSWNSIISAYVNMTLPDQAIRLFTGMLSQGYHPNHVTLLPLLSACAQLGDFRTGKWLESYVHTAKLRSPFLCSALIDMYAKCGVLDQSRRVFDSVPDTDKDTFIWNSMITGYAQNGMANEAIALFHMMKESNVNPDNRTLVGVLSACASIGALDLGKQLDDYAFNKGLYTNVFVGTALIDMYAKCGNLDGAIQVFDKMPNKNDATWNAFISALAFNGRGKHAVTVFHQMIEQGIRPDDITFIGVLSACVHAGLVQQGREWFDQMQVEFHICPKKEHYSCMVDLLARAGHLEEAWHFIEQMGSKADAVVLGALLAACRKRRCLEVGERVMEKLLEMEPSNSWNYVVSSRLYEGSKRLDDSARMRKLMRERAVTKTPGCSWIETCGEVHEFYAGHELDTRFGDVYQMIHLLVWEMRIHGYVPNTEL